MWDAVACILAVNSVWIPSPPRLRPTGLPFALFLLLLAWTGGILPLPSYTHDPRPLLVVGRAVCLTAVVDLLQTWIHRLSHTTLRFTPIGSSHMVHHLSKDPAPYDAFRTGYVDALVQLMLPVFFAIFLLSPDRTSLILFGSWYSWWLHFLHSPPKGWHSLLKSVGLVTPEDHRSHHRNPTLRFANVFRVCDSLVG